MQETTRTRIERDKETDDPRSCVLQIHEHPVTIQYRSL